MVSRDQGPVQVFEEAVSTPEGKVKIWLHRQLDWLMPDHWRVAPRGGPFGKGGCPDDLICWRGLFIAIEAKAEDGDLTALQEANLRKIAAAGGLAAVLRGKDTDRLLAIRDLALKMTEHLNANDHDVSDQ